MRSRARPECSAGIGPPRSGPTSADPSVYVRGGPSASDRRFPAAQKKKRFRFASRLENEPIRGRRCRRASGVCPITGQEARGSARALGSIPVFPLTDITKHEQRSLNQYFDISTGLLVFCKKIKKTKKNGFLKAYYNCACYYLMPFISNNPLTSRSYPIW